MKAKAQEQQMSTIMRLDGGVVKLRFNINQDDKFSVNSLYY